MPTLLAPRLPRLAVRPLVVWVEMLGVLVSHAYGSVALKNSPSMHILKT